MKYQVYVPTAVRYGTGCAFFFYVPQDGFANAHISFGWWNSSGKHFAARFDEAPTYGWNVLYMNGASDPSYLAGGVTKIQFQDNNGDTPGSTVIGWGASAAYGIEAIC